MVLDVCQIMRKSVPKTPRIYRIYRYVKKLVGHNVDKNEITGRY